MKITYKQEIKQNGQIANGKIIEILLQNRNIKDVNDFLQPKSPLSFSLKDFGFKKTDIDKAMKILKDIKEKEKMIVVYTDYDADGITGGSILWETLHLLGFKVMPYVPHRKLEGYGFSLKGIDTIKEKYDPGLIISVDHGITAVNQIAYAKKLGIPVIITDHHHKQEKIPEDAECIFHIPLLSGSGTAYYFAKEIFTSLRGVKSAGNLTDVIPDSDQGSHYNQKDRFRVNPGMTQGETASVPRNDEMLERYFSTDYLALASIGTIADLVPLVGPSRSVVKYGLQAFPLVKRYGIRHICREAGIEGRMITPYEVGYIIAPRINAVGRLEHAIDALRLLCTTDEARALALAGKVGTTNTARQDLVKECVEDAVAKVEEMKLKGELPKIIILHSKDWHEGVIGLIASNLLERYYCPVIIMTEADGQLKGSARSIISFHITEFFTSLKEYFINFGGHAQAAGFTIKKENLEEFIKKATKKAEKLIKDGDLERSIVADLKISLQNISMSLAKEIEKLNPFGVGNPHPTFVSDIEIVDAQLFGKKQDHLKIFAKDSASSAFPLELIQFGGSDKFSSLSRDKKMQVVYSLDINRWNGRESLRGKIVQLVESG